MAFRRWLRVAGVGLAALGVFAAAADRPAGAQVVTLTVKSAGDLLGKFRAAAKAAGGDAAKPVLDTLDQFQNGGALKWLDLTKPIAATADIPAAAPGGPPGPPSVNLFVPVTGRDAFLDALKGFGFAVDDQSGAAGFSHRVVQQGGGMPPLFLLAKSPAGYAVLTSTPADAVKLAAATAAALKPARPGAINLSVRLDRVPDQYKQSAIAALQQRNDAERQRKPGEDDAKYQGRTAGITLAEDASKSLVLEGRELALDLDVLPGADRLTLALALDAIPGTKMAAAMTSSGARRTRFQNLLPGAAANLRGVVTVTEAVRAQLKKGIESGRAQAAKEKDPEAKRTINLMLDALTPSLTGDVLDGCIVVGAPGGGGGASGSDKPGAAVVLFGVAVKGSEKVEAALREAIAKAKPEDRAKVSLDSAKAADGTAIHKVKVDDTEDKLKKSGITDPRLFLAFPQGAAIAVVGGSDPGLAAIKQAIAALKKGPAATVSAAPGAATEPQAALDVAASRLATMPGADNRDEMLKATKDVFGGANAGKDRVHVGLTNAAGRATLRLEADLPVLRFLSQVGVKTQAVQGKTEVKQLQPR